MAEQRGCSMLYARCGMRPWENDIHLSCLIFHLVARRKTKSSVEQQRERSWSGIMSHWWISMNYIEMCMILVTFHSKYTGNWNFWARFSVALISRWFASWAATIIYNRRIMTNQSTENRIVQSSKSNIYFIDQSHAPKKKTCFTFYTILSEFWSTAASAAAVVAAAARRLLFFPFKLYLYGVCVRGVCMFFFGPLTKSRVSHRRSFEL